MNSADSRNDNKIKKSNPTIQLKPNFQKQEISNETSGFFSFAVIIQNAIYFGFSPQTEKDYENKNFLKKIKIIVHNSVFVQLLICVAVSIMLVLLLRSKFTFNEEELKLKVDSEAQVKSQHFENVKNVPVIKDIEEDQNIIKLNNFKMEEFIKNISS